MQHKGLIEAFAAEYLSNGGNGARAVLKVWPETSYTVAKDKAANLLASSEVKELLARKCEVASLAATLSLAEKREFLADLVRADPRKVLASKPHLAQEVKVSRRILESGEVEETVVIKLPSKIQALTLDSKLAGELVDKMELGPLTPIDSGLDRLMGLADGRDEAEDLI